jgi:hypothetical protein
MAEFMSARRLDPRNAEIVLWLARTYAAAGEWAHAWIEIRILETKFASYDPKAFMEIKEKCERSLTADERRLLGLAAQEAGKGKAP